jgi:hypothetical protein
MTEKSFKHSESLKKVTHRPPNGQTFAIANKEATIFMTELDRNPENGSNISMVTTAAPGIDGLPVHLPSITPSRVLTL